MTSLTERTKAYRECHGFNELINIAYSFDTEMFATKSGDVAIALTITGLDAGCLSPEELEQVSSRVAAAAKGLDTRTVMTTYATKRSHPVVKEPRYEVVALDALIQNRERYLREKGNQLYSCEANIVLTYRRDKTSPRMAKRLARLMRNPGLELRKWFGIRGRARALDEEMKRSATSLRLAANNFIAQFGEGISARILDKAEAFSFFRRQVNLSPEKAAAVTWSRDAYIDYLIPDSQLDCYPDHLRLDNYYLKLLTLKMPPGQTRANIFSELSRVQSDLVIVTEWSTMDSEKATSTIRSKRRHDHNTKVSLAGQVANEGPADRRTLYDGSKEARVAELGAGLDEVENRGSVIGEFSLTIMVISDSLEGAEHAASEVRKVFGTHDASVTDERYNLLNAYLAVLPGGYPFNLRKLLITNRNYGDMGFWFQPAQGERRNRFLGAEHLLPLETEEGTLFFFNLHVEDVAHTIVLGRTGSGKTFLMNVLAAHAQKYSPYTFIITIGGGYEFLTSLFGGVSVTVRPGKLPFSINPFTLAPTAANLEFIFAFCKLLLETDGDRLSEGEERELYDSIRSIYVLGPEERRLQTLSTTLPRTLGKRLTRWIDGGQYGAFFDNVTDTVSFARFQYINFEGMEQTGAALEPLLFYLLHRASEIISDPALGTVLKLFFIDEAWRFLKHSVTRAYIAEALKTWRKKNAGVVLATQSLEDLGSGDSIRPIVESCPTKILLSNPHLDAILYGDVLRLTETEQERVRSLTAKRQFLLKRDSGAKVLNLNVDPRSYWLFTTNPFEVKRRQDLIDEFGVTIALNILTGGK